MQYQAISCESPNQLINKINYLLSQGWRVEGGMTISVASDGVKSYVQVLVKEPTWSRYFTTTSTTHLTRLKVVGSSLALGTHTHRDSRTIRSASDSRKNSGYYPSYSRKKDSTNKRVAKERQTVSSRTDVSPAIINQNSIDIDYFDFDQNSTLYQSTNTVPRAEQTNRNKYTASEKKRIDHEQYKESIGNQLRATEQRAEQTKRKKYTAAEKRRIDHEQHKASIGNQLEATEQRAVKIVRKKYTEAEKKRIDHEQHKVSIGNQLEATEQRVAKNSTPA